MAEKFGIDAKLYYDTDGVANDTWTECDIINGDVTLGLEKAEADATTRAMGGWKAVVAKMKEATLEFQIIWDTADAGFDALQSAFLNDTAIGIACMDGDITTVGNEGLKADMCVSRFNRVEAQDGLQVAEVTLKPTYSATAPAWYVTPAS